MASDGSTERLDSYETDLKISQADLRQKLEQIPELSGQERKNAITQAESALQDSRDLIGSMQMELSSIPQASRSKINQRIRNYRTDIDVHDRKLQSLSSDRSALLGSRYKDDPDATDELTEQRQQLISGTERLTRSSARLQDSQRVAHETEAIGAGVLRTLGEQREQIENTRGTLLEAEGYTDRSIKTLRGMARRMATNRIITISIITILVILIVAVIVSKFR